MLKYGALLFNTIALLIYQFFFADGITVTQNIPANGKPDSEFTVELTISKGTTGGFAKLQQDLPEGFTAVQDENNGASFTFSNQSVKFIWMSLPGEKEFKVKYKVKVAAGLSGDKIISGKFSYVTDNVKQSVDIAPATIKIDGGTSAASTPVATNTTPATTTPDNPTTATTPAATNTADNSLTTQLIDKSTPAPAEASSITCLRNVPANPSGDFTVEININKGNVSGFAKLLETLPAGFTATAIESQGASFSFLEGKVKYVWVSMPVATEFKISYKVSVAAGVSGSQNIDGVFSYIENDDTKKYVIPTSTVTIGSASQPVAATPVTTTPDNTPKSVAIAPVTTTPAETTPAPTPADKTSTATNTTDNTAKTLSASTIPAPQGNVNYKVQIAALRNAVEADKLAVRFNINQKIETEMAEGFTKYMVGSHNEYKSARDARETIKSNGVSDAFVTAYNSGKRITVQEALMITTQKWYR